MTFLKRTPTGFDPTAEEIRLQFDLQGEELDSRRCLSAITFVEKDLSDDRVFSVGTADLDGDGDSDLITLSGDFGIGWQQNLHFLKNVPAESHCETREIAFCRDRFGKRGGNKSNGRKAVPPALLTQSPDVQASRHRLSAMFDLVFLSRSHEDTEIEPELSLGWLPRISVSPWLCDSVRDR